jgi:hypothetical protein
VIIITPLDSQTDHTLKSIIRRIETKRKHRISDKNTLYQPVVNTSQSVRTVRLGPSTGPQEEE